MIPRRNMSISRLVATLVVLCAAVGGIILFRSHVADRREQAAAAATAPAAPLEATATPNAGLAGNPPAQPGATHFTGPGATATTIPVQNPPAVRVPDRELFGSAWGKGGSPEFAAFADWAREYLAAPEDERAALIGRGVDLATARREVMARFIRDNPREAIANTPPIAVRRQLPETVERLIEERVSGIGDVIRIMGLPPPGVKEPVPTTEQARVDSRYFTAHRYGERALTPTLKDVSIHGVALDEHLAVSASPVRVLELGETPASTTEVCVVTAGEPVLTPAEPAAVATTAMVGTHGYSMCCPFCVEDFDTRLARLEQRGMSTPRAIEAIGSGQPRELADSGVNGTDDFPGKPPVSLTHGAKKLLFMRVDFADRGYPGSLSEAYISDQVWSADGMNARIKRSSFNATSIDTADVTPVLRMPKNSDAYWKNPDGSTNMNLYWGPISDDAKAAARAAGFEPNNYTCRVIVHDGIVSGGAAGWGGGDTIWCNGNADKKLLLHEYGHVFWLPHANSWTSTDGNPLSASRAHVEYGDASDPMGNAWGAELNNDFNAYYKSLCGWLPDSAVLSISHSGTYRIHQFDGAANVSRTLALKITRENDLSFWLMYRGDPIPQGNFNTGATVLATPVGRAGDSHLVDMNDPSGNADNAPLAQAQVFDDTPSGVKLTTAGRGGQGSEKYMYVRVNFAAAYIYGHRPLVSGGIYALRNKSFDKYLDVPNNGANAGDQPQLYAYNGSPAQQWTAWRNTDGSYCLNHTGTAMWLDVSGNNGGNYAQIQQWTKNTSDAQKWEVSLFNDGFLRLRHRGTNGVLSADTANGGDVIQYEDFGGDEQKWEPRLIGMTEGVYRIVPRHAQSMAIGLRDRKTAAGTQVEQQSWSGEAWQRWALQSVGGGQFRIFPQDTPGQTLAIAGGATTDGPQAVLEPYTGAASQKFTFTHTDNGWVRITPAHAATKSLDVGGVSSAAGADLIQWQFVGGGNQQWRFDDADL